MAQEIPAWLDNTFLATALQGGEHAEPRVTVLSFSAEPAVPEGYNYTSYVFRVHVKYNIRLSSDLLAVSLIVKIPIEQGLPTKMDLFSTEPTFYSELLPKLSGRVNHEFGSKSFYCPLNNGIILSDLKADGFIMCNKLELLDYAHCNIVIVSLAKFHAASVACYQDNAKLIEDIGRDSIYKDHGTSEDCKLAHELSIELLLEILYTLEGQKENADLISKRAVNIWESVKNICKPKKSGLNVVNHGDCSLMNLMFKYKSGVPIDVKHVDFQIARYTSPVMDLIYFLLTSANEEVRLNKQQDLYNIYLQTLNNTLEDLSCDERYSFDELKQDLQQSIDFFIVTTAFIFPFIVSTSENSIDIGQIKSENFKNGKNKEMFRQMCSSKQVIKLLPVIMNQFQALINLSESVSRYK